MRTVLSLVLLLGFSIPCYAKAYYAGKKELIRKAECIAVVNITKVEKADKKGRPWTYRQRVSGTVERCLKGEAKGDITIYGMENFICAQCRYEEGRFLLFLRKQNGFWVGSNWHVGIRPIEGDKVQWFKDDKTRSEMKATPITDVLKEVTDIVEDQKKESN